MKKIQYLLMIFAVAAMLTGCNNEQPAKTADSTSETDTVLSMQPDSDIQQAEVTSAVPAKESTTDTQLAETTASESINAAKDTTPKTSPKTKTSKESTPKKSVTIRDTTEDTTKDTTEDTTKQQDDELPVLMLDEPTVSEQEEITKAPAQTMLPTKNTPKVTTTESPKEETTTNSDTTPITEDTPIELPFVPAE